ncbi:hypothetical protein CLPUN_09630 [Clostridium puniceum]|uniref:Uncharacterized protein n=1 Tax=Clostridium puniceum TaxID=29367 RepID=A0A1S8TVY5_9CLOT|nr:hypothetical protein [Clostridium puniceum]OOM81779.1 hypothetical protein CLPUN_09630 [Clostridium puniceum]
MKQIIYKCLNRECKVEFKGKNKDGLRCPICGSSISPFTLSPTFEELEHTYSYEQLNGHYSKQINSKVIINNKIVIEGTVYIEKITEGIAEKISRSLK